MANSWSTLYRILKSRRKRGIAKRKNVHTRARTRTHGNMRTYNDPEDIARFAMKQEKDIIIGVGSVEEYIKSNIQQNRFVDKKQTFVEKTKIIAAKKDWNEYIHGHYKGKYRIVQDSDYTGWIINDKDNSYIHYYISGDTTTINFVGDESFVFANKDIIEQDFTVVQSYIKWIHGADGNYVTLALNDAMLPCDEMYPFLNGEALKDYYDRFMRSTASILLLIGPPGTGKTTFIRGLLDHAKTSATVTYDPNILSKDSIFADYLEDDECSIMVLEDSDSFLSSRSEGNNLMHKFLNVGDGLVTVKGKKMIFSTNLPSVRDVDQALLRPGRCFDVVKFSPLNIEEATKLTDKLGINLPEKQDGQYSIAEVFHEMNVRPVHKFGFNQ